MVAINSAIEVDLTGQVCAESIGSQFYSGFGGQLDFIRGAARSKCGKPIIALPSTAKNDTVSRIVPRLAHGAGVLTGAPTCTTSSPSTASPICMASTIRQRAEALIEIAHPKFRDELVRILRKTTLVSAQRLRTWKCEENNGIATAR